MSGGAILSGLLHLAVILIVIFGLPWWYEPTEVLEATSVTVVSPEQLAQMQKSQRQPAQQKPTPPKDTAIPQAPKAPDLPEPKPEPEPAPAPEPQPKTQPEPAPVVEATPEPQPEPQPQPEPAPAPQDETEQQAVIAPPVPQPEPPPEPVVPPEQPVAEAQPKPLPPQKPKPPKKKKAEDKPKEKPKEEQASLDASALIDKLSKKSKQSASQPQQTQEAALPTDNYDGPPITEGEKDMIRQQIEGNWIVDVGMPGLEEMIVEINVQMNPDGTVQSAKVDPSGNNGNPNWTIYAESCRRAVLKSSPLRMPPEKPYPAWAKMTLVFNAKQMLGL